MSELDEAKDMQETSKGCCQLAHLVGTPSRTCTCFIITDGLKYPQCRGHEHDFDGLDASLDEDGMDGIGRNPAEPGVGGRGGAGGEG